MNELLAGADSMVSTGTDIYDEYFDMFRKLCHGLHLDQIKEIYKEITSVYEQVYEPLDKSINKFDILGKLYMLYQCKTILKEACVDFDKGLRSAYLYVYSELYMDTLIDFYQRGSKLESCEHEEKEHLDTRWFSLTLDRCGLKNPNIYATYPGIVILHGGEKYYALTSVKPCKVKQLQVRPHRNSLFIDYDMFTMKFKKIIDEE